MINRAVGCDTPGVSQPDLLMIMGGAGATRRVRRV
jgi:hypothetical protein